MFNGIMSKFVVDALMKGARSGLTALVGAGIVTNDQSTVLMSGAGIIITIAVSAGLNLIQNKTIVKVDLPYKK